MELFQNKSSQRDLDLYSSQRHLVDTEIHSTSDETNISIEYVESPVRHNKNTSRKKSTNSSIVDNNTNMGLENNALENEIKIDETNLLSDYSEQQKNDSSPNHQSDNIEIIQDNIILDSETSVSSLNSMKNNGTVIYDHNTKKKKRHRKKNGIDSKSPESKTNNISEEIELTTIRENAQEKPSESFKIIGIYIHGIDILRNHPFIGACKFQINFYNYETGKCLNNSKLYKTDIHSRIWESTSLGYVEPQWNELIIFESSLIELMEKNKKILIFLQLYEVRKNVQDSTYMEHELIAWAFLKPVSDNETSYLNKKIKLQLYEPVNWNNSYKVYNCWSKKPWKIYPSVVHVTAKGFKINKREQYVNTIQYSTYNTIKHCNTSEGRTNTSKPSHSDSNSQVLKKRDDKQKCKVFNFISNTIQDGGKTCFTMKFSPCGNYLAYAVKLDDVHTINILRVAGFTQEAKLTKHKNMIYDLSWNCTSSLLISASSDNTVCVWEQCDSKFTLFQQLNHDTFVYSARFCGTSENIIATGGLDKTVRMWIVNDNNFHLHQELDGHEGFINAVCFGKTSKSLYSGDSTGLIIKWNYECGKWHQLLLIKCSEIRNHIINDLIVFPDNQKLLIVLRNSVSWALDTSTSTLVLCYRNGINYRYQLRGCISPCGSLVFIGNCVWNSTTAQLLAIYNPLVFDYHTVTAIDHHPFYSITSMACGFISSPILVCGYQDNKSDDINLNMEVLKYENENIHEHLSSTGKTILPYITTNRKIGVNELDNPSNNNNGESNASVNETEKVHSSKLWHIINKMDLVIYTAKNGNKSKDEHTETKVQIGDNENPQQLHELLNKEEQEELKIDIESQHSDGTYTIENDNDGQSTLSEAESIHTYTVTPK